MSVWDPITRELTIEKRLLPQKGRAALGGWFLVALTGVIAWKIAEFEERTPWPWAVIAVTATLLAHQALGQFAFVAPVVVLGGIYGAMWKMRTEDDDAKPPGSGIVR